MHFRAIVILNPITAGLETIWFKMYVFGFIVFVLNFLDEFGEFAWISLEKSNFFNFIRRGQFRSKRLISTDSHSLKSLLTFRLSTLVGFR